MIEAIEKNLEKAIHLLNTITEDLHQYYTEYTIDSVLVDCEIFAGRRLILDVTI